MTVGTAGSTRSERVGWYFYDWANSAYQTTVVAVFLGPYLTAAAQTASGCTGEEACRLATVDVFGVRLATGSFYPAVVAAAVVLNVLLLPVVGAVADRSRHKRRMLAAAAFTGAAATVGVGAAPPGSFRLMGMLVVVATMAFAASIVVSNSFLPQLADAEGRDRVSSTGWALGYLGGGLLLAANLVALTFLEDRYGTGTLVRVSIASAGLWWALFTLVPLRRLVDREPVGVVAAAGGRLTQGFGQLWDTLRHLKAYPLTLFFLLAYLVYNDGIQTVINLASLYGTEELRLSQSTLVVTILLVQFLAFFGAVGLGRLAAAVGAWKTVLVSLVLWIGVILAAFRLPAGQPAQFMALGAVIGVVLGGSQALSRSLFSQLVPRGREAEYFGFYEISDKGTSWLGPAAFALVFQVSHSYRAGLVSLLGFFVIGFVLLAAVPMRRAIVAAGNTPPRVL